MTVVNETTCYLCWLRTLPGNIAERVRQERPAGTIKLCDEHEHLLNPFAALDLIQLAEPARFTPLGAVDWSELLRQIMEENRAALDACTGEPGCPSSIHFPKCWSTR